jgi:hypothetical protein
VAQRFDQLSRREGTLAAGFHDVAPKAEVPEHQRKPTEYDILGSPHLEGGTYLRMLGLGS